MAFTLRKAVAADVGRIAELIAVSVRGLAKGIYSEEQIEHSIRSVFGVDDQLIVDETYFVVETEGVIVGCGGWSKRKTLYGASAYDLSRDPGLLNPKTDSAKIRAFFIHPDWARQGIGTTILDACEKEAKSSGFSLAEMMATLPGVPLYAARGYHGDEHLKVPVGEGVEILCVRMQKKLV
jgi:GNAT superfamily N-acetyltransferase